MNRNTKKLFLFLAVVMVAILVFLAGLYRGMTGDESVIGFGLWMLAGLWAGGLGELVFWALGITAMWALMKIMTHAWKTLVMPIFARRQVAKIVSSPLWLSGKISQRELTEYFPPEEHRLTVFIMDLDGTWLACPVP